jgi:hypothetical protein
MPHRKKEWLTLQKSLTKQKGANRFTAPRSMNHGMKQTFQLRITRLGLNQSGVSLVVFGDSGGA